MENYCHLFFLRVCIFYHYNKKICNVTICINAGQEHIKVTKVGLIIFQKKFDEDENYESHRSGQQLIEGDEINDSNVTSKVSLHAKSGTTSGSTTLTSG